MPLIRKPLRYAHPDGHTDVCYYSGDKGGLVTCGFDGDVRTWLDLMDDDPSATCVSEQAIAVISKKDKIYVGHDNNAVQILSYPDLEKDGIAARFSAPVTTLATASNSNLIVCGSGDMRIQVYDITTKKSIEFTGHDAPILGLSLDPKEEFIASSSADGTIRVWSIKEKESVKIWDNIVPKANSFFTANRLGTPSFQSKKGDYLAYPHGKQIIVVDRSSWTEAFKLNHKEIKQDLSICKFSECGKYLAASSVYGEMVAWDIETKNPIGYIEHQSNTRITCFAWSLKGSNEIAFCDSRGHLGCIEVIASEENSLAEEKSDLMVNGDLQDDIYNNIDDFGDDDDGIDISKIKSSVLNADDDQESISHLSIKSKPETRIVPEFNLQKAFQPSSSPVHLLSRYMVWNEVAVVTCYRPEDDEESSIEVNFHDVAVHHSIHINNYLNHTLSSVSTEALAFACPATTTQPSKLVVMVLQGWGSGNKEWTTDLPEGEEAQAIAVGNCFVAVATNARALRIFMIGGTQREVLMLPGPVVCMNGRGNNLAVAYHTGIGVDGDQHMNLLWIKICGPNLKSHTLPLPLSPTSNLMWLGFTDLGSPVVMDEEGIISIYDKRSSLWRVACDTSRMNKGKLDHYFLIGIEEMMRTARCILCKGGHYPPVTPRPIVNEIEMTIPLCDPTSEKSSKEAIVWQLGSSPVDEKESLLALIALACRNNVEYRAVELCQQIASQKVIELAMKYAVRIHRMGLANKLESIAESKDSDEVIKQSGSSQEDMFSERNDETEEDTLLPLNQTPIPEIEIRPLTPTQIMGRRSNPFLKKKNDATSKGLAGLNSVEVPVKAVSPLPPVPKAKSSPVPKKETFVSWYSKNKKKLEQDYPDLDPPALTKKGFALYKEEISGQPSSLSNFTQDSVVSTVSSASENESQDLSKKRKLSSSGEPENDPNQQVKRSAASKLAAFLRN